MREKEMRMEMELFLLLWLFMSCCSGNAGRTEPAASSTASSGTFNVKNFGAGANGMSDDSLAFLSAWKAACNATGAVKLLVPGGTYLLGPTKFHGPCPNAESLTVHMQGTLKATTDLSKYGDSWVEFGWVNNLVLTGGGTFNGQGEVSWPFNKCPKNKNCRVLPTSIKFVSMNGTVVKSIKSLNSKFFHIALLHCNNFEGSNIMITAPDTSPNTDGIHIERCTDVRIHHSKIGTGDDCLSVGQGNSQIEITNINCGPGHGISVGSLGRYKNEGDVRGLIVKDCTLTGTDNGVRIKTWENSPGASMAANMTFENIIMNNVMNPIIIDQTYCPFASCDTSVPSRVKISDITFKNIRGTSKTPVAVTLECSKGNPCKNVKLHDVHLNYVGGGAAITSTATCQNVEATYIGTQIPPPCK